MSDPDPAHEGVVRELANAYGVATDYWDWQGRHVEVPVDTMVAVLGALAWFLKRYGPKVAGGNANLRVVGSLNLGGRERIVVVEVGNEWIVVGASPGRINALATMPRQDGQNGEVTGTNAALAPHGPAAHSFADWLKQTIDKRK